VPLRAVHLERDPVCLEYEYVPGGDLGAAIREGHQSGRLTPGVAGSWLRELAAVMAFPHQMSPPLVHRDLKPANVLVPPAADGAFRPRVIDFGISEVAATRALGEATRAATGRSALQATVVRGAYTPLYASPQQIRGEAADPRDDVHALGVVWHQMLTGDLSHGRPSGRGWRRQHSDRGMSAELLDLLEVCTDDDPHERPADAGDLVRRLDALLLAGRVVVRPEVVRNALGMVLVRVPAGRFLMGSPDTEPGRADDERPHEVAITRPILLAAHLVTQDEFARLMGHNPSTFAEGRPGGPVVRGMATGRFPVDSVTHDEALEFCRRLSELPEEKAAGRVYRLPSEAEWEYACRAGTATPFAFGDGLASTRANFDGHYPAGDAGQGAFLQRTSEVGAYPANAWGFHDLHGNVWEWCADWYGPYPLASLVATDPTGPPSGRSRVLRGGSWYNSAGSCRSATRNKQPPGQRVRNNGFRVACDLLGG
jgi:formylglycine-generating enzyme required for sulfatase activity